MYKKLVVAVGLVLVLSACESTPVVTDRSNEKSVEERASFEYGGNVRILTDTDTGCKYVVIDEGLNMAKMSPYYGANGEVQGCGVYQ